MSPDHRRQTTDRKDRGAAVDQRGSQLSKPNGKSYLENPFVIIWMCETHIGVRSLQWRRHDM